MVDKCSFIRTYGLLVTSLGRFPRGLGSNPATLKFYTFSRQQFVSYYYYNRTYLVYNIINSRYIKWVTEEGHDFKHKNTGAP